MYPRTLGIFGLVFGLLLTAVTAVAVAYHCSSCGRECCPRKVCVLKCETKKVPQTVYTFECEDICVPGRSKKCGETCDIDECGSEKKKTNWIPQCAEVVTRKKLVKKTIEKEETVYKWAVESVCD